MSELAWPERDSPPPPPSAGTSAGCFLASSPPRVSRALRTARSVRALAAAGFTTVGPTVTGSQPRLAACVAVVVEAPVTAVRDASGSSELTGPVDKRGPGVRAAFEFEESGQSASSVQTDGKGRGGGIIWARLCAAEPSVERQYCAFMRARSCSAVSTGGRAACSWRTSSWENTRDVPTCPICFAMSAALSPSGVLVRAQQPARRSISTAFSWPYQAAWCSAVHRKQKQT